MKSQRQGTIAPRGFTLLDRAGVKALVRVGYESSLASLDPAESQARRVGSVSGGRVIHPIVELPNGERVVVREYRRGGFVRHVNRSRYFLGHRAMAELVVTERAAEAGVRTSEIVAAIERTAGIGYTASIATRWIPNGLDLATWLEGPAAREKLAALFEAGSQIARMHDAGITHPDLNLRNFLVVPSPAPVPQVYLLDFDRAHIQAPEVGSVQRALDVKRLLRSARKLGVSLEGAELRVLADGYGRRWPVTITLD